MLGAMSVFLETDKAILLLVEIEKGNFNAAPRPTRKID